MCSPVLVVPVAHCSSFSDFKNSSPFLRSTAGSPHIRFTQRAMMAAYPQGTLCFSAVMIWIIDLFSWFKKRKKERKVCFLFLICGAAGLGSQNGEMFSGQGKKVSRGVLHVGDGQISTVFVLFFYLRALSSDIRGWIPATFTWTWTRSIFIPTKDEHTRLNRAKPRPLLQKSLIFR